MASSTKNRLILLIFLVLLMLLPTKNCSKAEGAQTDQNKSAATKNKKEDKKKPKNKRDDPDEIGNRDVGKGINFYSLEKEIALGKSLAQEIEKQVKLVDDPIIAEYVNRVGQNLVRNSDSKVPFTIKIIDSEVPNAVSLPGGFFFVNSGLILLADNEAEMAGAMAHEIAHVAARHGTRQATRGQVVNFATIPLIFAGGWGGYGARQAAGLAIPLGFMQFSRAFEREADSLGLQYLYATGYDPNSMAEMFERMERLEKTKPGTISKLFRSHPMAEDRVKAAQKEIQETLTPKAEYVVSTSEFLDVKARLSALYARPKSGAQEKDQSGRPTLRKSPNSGKIDPEDKNKPEKEDDERPPELKRR